MSIPVSGTAYVAASGEPGSSRSGVTWSAIFAGAAVAAAVSLILLLLGSALGFASVSPWPYRGASAAAFGVGAAIWLIVTQWIAAGVGGYLTGRLRLRWTGVHTHEVFFRDTAHGFLSWAVATLATVALIALAGSAVLGAGTRAASNVVAGAAQGGMQGMAQRGPAGLGTPSGYFTDMLFRVDNPPAANAAPPAGTGAPSTDNARPPATGVMPGHDSRAEASTILLRSIGTDMSADDKTYLAKLVAAQTGMSQDDAVKRVDAVNAQIKATEDKAKDAADKARKAAATASLFAFLALLIGAFIASIAAAFGGSQRDEYESVYLEAR
jgi:hypothetical protein